MALADTVQFRSSHRALRAPACFDLPEPRTDPTLRLLVTLPGTSAVRATRALRRTLGERTRLYVVKIDRSRTTVTLQIETTRGALTDLIGLLVAGLSEAMVGSVRANVV
jgi:hypothetical protein